MIIALILNKNQLFKYIKIISMSRLIIGYKTCSFIPFKNKSHTWKNKLYIIIYAIKHEYHNIIIISINSSTWFKGLGKALAFKNNFYCLYHPTHVKVLINKIGLIGYENSFTTKISNTPILDNNYNLNYYCFTFSKCFKVCKHCILNTTEYISTKHYLYVTLLSHDICKTKQNNIIRYCNNHSKQIIRTTILSILIGKGTLWDIGSGYGRTALESKILFNNYTVCIEYNSSKIKSLVHNFITTGYNSDFYDTEFNNAIISSKLPNKVIISCGLKKLWHWRFIYVHIKTNGLVILTVISNITYTNIGILICIYKAKLFSLIISKMVLRLNNRIYRTYSTILICIVKKDVLNHW